MVTSARRAFLGKLDAAAVEAAIHRAEGKTTGEVRVSIAGFFHGDPRRLAERAFRRLGMGGPRDHNGVLIFVAPGRRRVVVLGDAGIHALVGQAFWQDVATQLARELRSGDATKGLVRAVEAVGEELARHFPPGAGPNVNELPDTIDFRR